MTSKNPLRNKRVLLTYGPTWVAIDDVRVLSNISTGQLGKTLALLLRKTGAQVTVLEGPITDPLKDKRVRIISFRFFTELQKAFTAEIKRGYDIVIHAAAVSDYRPARVHPGKLSSGLKRFSLDLIPTLKLIDHVKRVCPHAFLVGFRLESAGRKISQSGELEKLFTNARCDLIIANQLENKKYSGYILDRQKKILAKAHSRAEMARKLINVIKRTTKNERQRTT